MLILSSDETKLDVFWEKPETSDEKKEIIELEKAILSWPIDSPIKCVLKRDVLTCEIAAALSRIFCGSVFDKLISGGLQFQFKEIQEKALDKLFEETEIPFPENTSFICLEDIEISSWINAITLALKHKKFSENTFIEFQQNELSISESQALTKLFAAPTTPKQLMLMYLTMNKKGLNAINSTQFLNGSFFERPPLNISQTLPPIAKQAASEHEGDGLRL